MIRWRLSPPGADKNVGPRRGRWPPRQSSAMATGQSHPRCKCSMQIKAMPHVCAKRRFFSFFRAFGCVTGADKLGFGVNLRYRIGRFDDAGIGFIGLLILARNDLAGHLVLAAIGGLLLAFGRGLLRPIVAGFSRLFGKRKHGTAPIRQPAGPCSSRPESVRASEKKGTFISCALSVRKQIPM